MNFQTSTQLEKWTFTPETLLEIRTANREHSITVIKQVRQADASTPQEGTDVGEKAKKSDKLRAVTLEEEGKLHKYYAGKIQELCRAFGFPHKVAATGITYLHRAYTAFSCLDHDPKNIMLACIYLAGKIEDAYIGAEEFCRQVKQEEAALLRNEVLLLQALSFDLIVYAPYRAVTGFLMDLEAWQAEMPGCGGNEGLQSITGGRLDHVRAAANGATDVLMLTDAPLLYTPGQLALAALRSGMRKVGVAMDVYLCRVAARACQGSGKLTGQASQDDGKVDSLLDVLGRIDALGVLGATAVDASELRKVDRKLKLCHNPLTDPTSTAFQAAAAAQQQQLALARLQKAQAHRAAADAREAALLGAAPINSEEGDSRKRQMAEEGEDGARGKKRRRSDEPLNVNLAAHFDDM